MRRYTAVVIVGLTGLAARSTPPTFGERLESEVPRFANWANPGTGAPNSSSAASA